MAELKREKRKITRSTCWECTGLCSWFEVEAHQASYKGVSRCCATPDKGWSGKILIVRNTNLENDERKLE